MGTQDLNVSRTSIGTYTGPYPGQSGVASRVTQTHTKVTGNTPNYQALKKAGALLPINNYTHSSSTTCHTQGYLSKNDTCWVPGGARWSGCLNGVAGAPAPGDMALSSGVLNGLYNEVQRKLLLNAKDQKVNLMQAFAERKQTANLVANTAKSLATMFRSLKRADLKGAGEALGLVVGSRQATRFRQQVMQEVGGSRRMSQLLRNSKYNELSRAHIEKSLATGVLQLQYGWKPLLSDVFGSAELIAQKQLREVRNFSKSAGTRTDKIRSTVVNAPAGRKDEYQYDTTVSYRMGVLFASSSDTMHTLAQVGISNPALVAWELVPWSFVVDWFIPIGNYISASDATNGLTFIQGYTSHKTTCKSDVTTTWDGTKCYQWSNWMGQTKGSRTSESYVRTKMLSWPKNEVPKFKNPVSFDHAINAIALLRQVVKR